MSRAAYRGQAHAEWKLLSGAVRRLQRAHDDCVLDDDNELTKLVSDYHKEHLIIPMAVIDGERMSALQRLSVLQHHGAATGMLDFTENALVALWFACAEEPSEDGKVFMLDIGDPQVATNGRTLPEENDPFNAWQQGVYYYEPDRSLGSRIVAQQSVFVIGIPEIPDHHLTTVVVRQAVKKDLRDYLTRLGLSDTVLFGDVPGLARANATSIPLLRKDRLTPTQYRDRGNRAYQARQYDDALAYYESFVLSLPDVAQAHCLVGDTLAALNRFEEAISAYTRAMEKISRPIDLGPEVILHRPTVGPMMLHTLYYNRGNAYAATEKHDCAVADFDRALEHGNYCQVDVLFNRGNSKYRIGRFEEAHQDFEALWFERQMSTTALAMGNCKVKIGKFEEALQRYLDGASVGDPNNAATHCRENGEQLQPLLSTLNGRKYPVMCEGSIVYVKAPYRAATFPFVGHPGNAGNSPSGMTNVPGGQGFSGTPGFAVTIVPTRI